jgi:hypothetical protein
MRYISVALDQYTGICKEALQDCASKLSKSYESAIIEVLLLYMVIPATEFLRDLWLGAIV